MKWYLNQLTEELHIVEPKNPNIVIYIQLYPANFFLPHFSNLRFNIILLFMHRLLSCYLPVNERLRPEVFLFNYVIVSMLAFLKENY
jgi:hypothetical protein